MKLDELAKAVHADHAKWWQDPKTGQRIDRNKGELRALIASELSEALEGERKSLMDDHLPHRKMAEVEMADAVIRILDYAGGFAIPLSLPRQIPERLSDNRAEAIWQIHTELVLFGIYSSKEDVKLEEVGCGLGTVLCFIIAYCSKFGYDLQGAIEEKRAYNLKRADHTHAARLAPGGKAF
jgi:hypothetical protein